MEKKLKFVVKGHLPTHSSRLRMLSEQSQHYNDEVLESRNDLSHTFSEGYGCLNEKIQFGTAKRINHIPQSVEKANPMF